MDKKWLINIIIGVSISLVLVWLLLRQINLNLILTSIKSISISVLATAFMLYIVSNIFRAQRFRIISSKKYSLKYFFDVTSVLNMMNVLLPSRMGELSYLYLLKKSGTKVTEGIASLFLARIFDFIALSTIFLVTVLFITRNRLIQSIMLIIGLILLSFTILFITFIIYENKFIIIIKHIAKKLYLDKNNTAKIVFKKIFEVTQSLHAAKSKKAVLQIMLYTYLIWLSYYLISYLILRSAGFHISIITLSIGLTLSVLSSIIPISGIAGFGTYEAYWTIIFISLGVEKEAAITFGFVNHIINLLYVVVIGIISFFMLNSKYNYFQKNNQNIKSIKD